MKPSSIFSFDTLERLPRPTAPVWVALAICAVVRLALAYGGSERLVTVPPSGIDRLYLINEARLHTEREVAPEVLIMGTSRLGGVTPECLAPRMGVPESAVANFSLAGSTFWRTELFFRRNPAALRKARVVVVDLLPYQLYESILFTGRDPLFLREATLDERMGLNRLEGRALAFADTVFPAWSERRDPVWLRKALGQVMDPAADRYAAFLNELRTNPAASAMETEDPDQQDEASKVTGYAPAPDVSPVQMASVRDLAELLPPGCRLLLIWMPVRPSFVEYLETDPVGQASYAEFKAFVDSLDLPNVDVEWVERPEALGLSDADYSDIVHYTPDGFEKVCAFFAEVLAPYLEGAAD